MMTPKILTKQIGCLLSRQEPVVLIHFVDTKGISCLSDMARLQCPWEPHDEDNRSGHVIGLSYTYYTYKRGSRGGFLHPMFVDYMKKLSQDAALFHPKDHLESDLLFLGLVP